jgi:malate dehydrogenase (oxaloacetate-decarboxylating)(NADP+)
MPTLDAANISFNLLGRRRKRAHARSILLGVAKLAHILTPSATVRRIVT